MIARLPFVTTLNGGGEITRDEREDAERAFVRYYMDKPESDRPARYEELAQKHGKLDPLVNIDLRPEKRVKVRFSYGEHSEERSVDVYRWVSIGPVKERHFINEFCFIFVNSQNCVRSEDAPGEADWGSGSEDAPVLCGSGSQRSHGTGGDAVLAEAAVQLQHPVRRRDHRGEKELSGGGGDFRSLMFLLCST